VADKRVLTDGKQTLELYHLAGPITPHYADRLLPEGEGPHRSRCLHAWPANAPPGLFRKRPSIYNDNLQRLKLNVEQITPLHGRLATINDLKKAIGRISYASFYYLGAAQRKVSGSSMLPLPVYTATCGYGQSGRVRPLYVRKVGRQNGIRRFTFFDPLFKSSHLSNTFGLRHPGSEPFRVP